MVLPRLLGEVWAEKQITRKQHGEFEFIYDTRASFVGEMGN